MKKLLLFLLLNCGCSWASGQGTLQLPVDTLREWYAIKKTTESILGTRTTLWQARSAEALSLRKAIEQKDAQIKTLEQLTASYEHSLSTCQQERSALTKKNGALRGWNKGLLAGLGVLTAILVLR